LPTVRPVKLKFSQYSTPSITGIAYTRMQQVKKQTIRVEDDERTIGILMYRRCLRFASCLH
ncbi:hypothetical protein, partial [Paraburkholderia hospita]|uniref:hypothetical protein n=1 Tax=Paraburkholderia hospita TaxID=169430 RepID=UPI001A991D1B